MRILSYQRDPGTWKMRPFSDTLPLMRHEPDAPVVAAAAAPPEGADPP